MILCKTNSVDFETMNVTVKYCVIKLLVIIMTMMMMCRRKIRPFSRIDLSMNEIKMINCTDKTG